VVPGVTSAIAVAAAAGIPVTHRGVARGFTVVTGHEELLELPARSDHTIVVLMGVKRLRTTFSELVDAGHNPNTPAAIIERGFASDQRVTVGTIADLPDKAEQVGARSPAITVIGDVVGVLSHP